MSVLAIVGKSPNAVLAYTASQVGSAATEAAMRTILARYLDYQKRYGFGLKDLQVVCRRLIHPSVLAGIRFPSDLEAKFAEFSAPQIEVVKSRQNALKQYEQRSLPAASPGEQPSLIGTFTTGSSLGTEIETVIRQAQGAAQEVEAQGEGETQSRAQG